MSDTVISVKNISKRYRIGVKEKTETFAQQFVNLIAYPIKNLRRIASLNSFKDGEDPSVFWALKDINFEVKQGEVLGIIGRNGAGKSTLLKILSRITEPTSGQIEIRGRVSSLLEVGTGFHPELTGRDNVYMNGTILGMTKKEIDKKFDEIIDFSGIEKHIDTPVKFYSSGMTVRLAFSVAAHLEPEILIIDEVLAVGDAEFQKKCLGKMEDVAGQGRTVLFVSHNMAAVRNLCQNGILLKNGIIFLKGTSEECISKYILENENNFNTPNLISANKDGFSAIIDVREKGSINNIVYSGKSISINIEIDVPHEIKFGGIGLGINDMIGNRIITFHSNLELKDKIYFKNKVKINIEEDFNKLCPGTYTLILSIFDGDKSIISWPNIGNIHISEFDVYNTGKLPNTSYQGQVLSNAKWEIN